MILRHNLGCKETDVLRIPSLLYMHKLSFPLIIMKDMIKSIREDRTILEGCGISAIWTDCTEGKNYCLSF